MRTVVGAMWHGLETRLVEVEAQLEHGYCGGTETSVGRDASVRQVSIFGCVLLPV